MGGDGAAAESHAAQELFDDFVQATTCRATLRAFSSLCGHLQLPHGGGGRPPEQPLPHGGGGGGRPPEQPLYHTIKQRLNYWKANGLWAKLDKRASHPEYMRGHACANTTCVVIGAGPCGLRAAVELGFMGARVVLMEKRDGFSRNNVLHLWPQTIHDLRGLGAKKLYGKFCAGSIDHISIRQLQLVLLKVALLLGVEVHVNVEFKELLEPPENQKHRKVGWRVSVHPKSHPISQLEFDVIIGADGRRNTLAGFRRKEFRGKLAIAITANFKNRNTTAEAKVEEISGVAFIFNQRFFTELRHDTGIDLENIVYYKDDTHYFVMTAKKHSLLEKGVILQDFVDTELLLSRQNVDQHALQAYAREAAGFSTNHKLPSLDFAMNHYGQPDVAMFDFTTMYASENAARVRTMHGHTLLITLVGDSLLEPFWPMGTGIARGFLAALDTAWMIRSWAQGHDLLDVLAERESLYRLLPQTTPENIHKNMCLYTVDPATRYPNITPLALTRAQVSHLVHTGEEARLDEDVGAPVRPPSLRLLRQESSSQSSKLLAWCQDQTHGYGGVSVSDLTSSWKTGLALCALIHHYRPDLLDFSSLVEAETEQNMALGVELAERAFGICPVMTVEEMLGVEPAARGEEPAGGVEPDSLSMVLYLTQFYQLLKDTAPSSGFLAQSAARRATLTAPTSLLSRLGHKRYPKEQKDALGKRRRTSEPWKNEQQPEVNVSTRDNSQSTEEDAVGVASRSSVRLMANRFQAKLDEGVASCPSPSPSSASALLRRQAIRSMLAGSVGSSDVCFFCRKRVYVMERLSAEGLFFHRACFTCDHCGSTLRPASYAYDAHHAPHGRFYCLQHYDLRLSGSAQRKRPSTSICSDRSTSHRRTSGTSLLSSVTTASSTGTLTPDGRKTSVASLMEPRGSGPLMEPRGSGPLMEPRGSGSLMEPRGSGPLMESRGSGSLMEPRGSGPLMESRGSGSLMEPRGSGPLMESRGSGPLMEPRGSGPLMEPRGSGSLMEPRGSGPLMEPRGSGPLMEPRGSGPLMEPRGSGSLMEPSRGSGPAKRMWRAAPDCIGLEDRGGDVLSAPPWDTDPPSGPTDPSSGPTDPSSGPTERIGLENSAGDVSTAPLEVPEEVLANYNLSLLEEEKKKRCPQGCSSESEVDEEEVKATWRRALQRHALQRREEGEEGGDDDDDDDDEEEGEEGEDEEEGNDLESSDEGDYSPWDVERHSGMWLLLEEVTEEDLCQHPLSTERGWSARRGDSPPSRRGDSPPSPSHAGSQTPEEPQEPDSTTPDSPLQDPVDAHSPDAIPNTASSTRWPQSLTPTLPWPGSPDSSSTSGCSPGPEEQPGEREDGAPRDRRFQRMDGAEKEGKERGGLAEQCEASSSSSSGVGLNGSSTTSDSPPGMPLSGQLHAGRTDRPPGPNRTDDPPGPNRTDGPPGPNRTDGPPGPPPVSVVVPDAVVKQGRMRGSSSEALCDLYGGDDDARETSETVGPAPSSLGLLQHSALLQERSASAQREMGRMLKAERRRRRTEEEEVGRAALGDAWEDAGTPLTTETPLGRVTGPLHGGSLFRTLKGGPKDPLHLDQGEAAVRAGGPGEVGARALWKSVFFSGGNKKDRAKKAVTSSSLPGTVSTGRERKGAKKPKRATVSVLRGSPSCTDESELASSIVVQRCSLNPRTNLRLELFDQLASGIQKVVIKEDEKEPPYVAHALAFKRAYAVKRRSVKEGGSGGSGVSSCRTEVSDLTETTATETLFHQEVQDPREETLDHRDHREVAEDALDARITRRVQKAARRQARQEQLKRLHKAQIIQRQLEQVEEKQRQLEERGVAVEKALRGEADYWGDSNENPGLDLHLGGMGKMDSPTLMQQWFHLVQQKNTLGRYESELTIFARELELEDRQSRLQQTLRERMAVDDHLKQESELAEERLILEEMLEVVEQRDALVSLLETQRLTEHQEDRDLEDVMLSRGLGLHWA